MTGILRREKQIEWACRILMTVDIIIISAGYVSFFQAKNQLMSPLIPKSTVYQISYDSNDTIMKASLISCGLFLIGLWFYSFKKKVVALILFSLAVIACMIIIH
jgi:hypothetical protein